jgi:sn-glycerol 3-phosphate transport system substrate-binding protein
MPASPSFRTSAPWRTTVGALVGVGALVLASCGSPPTTGSGGGREDAGGNGGGVDPALCPLEALEEADGPVTLNLWYGGLVEPASTTLTGLVDDFNASQDKVRIQADNQGVAYAEVLRKYQGASATPAQLPDMIYLEDTTLGEMVDKGQVLPAQACMEADGYDLTDITASARAAYEVDGVLYPGYMNVSSPILYFNKADFQEAGIDLDAVPLTLADLEETARTLKEAGVADKPLSFLSNQWFFNTWLIGAGDDVVNNSNGRTSPPTEATFDTEKALELLSWLKRMNDEGLLNPFPVTDGSIDHYLALVRGTSSMLVETSTASGTIAAALGGEITAADAGIDLDAAVLSGANIVPASGQMPGIDSPGQVFASGGAFYMLNAGSDAEKAASWQFMKFMLQPENAKRWHLEGGYIPVVKEAVNDPEVLEFQRNELDGVLLKPSVEQLGAADPDRVSPLVGPMTQFQDIVQGMMEQVLFNGADPAQALTDAETAATALLEDYNG